MLVRAALGRVAGPRGGQQGDGLVEVDPVRVGVRTFAVACSGRRQQRGRCDAADCVGEVDLVPGGDPLGRVLPGADCIARTRVGIKARIWLPRPEGCERWWLPAFGASGEVSGVDRQYPSVGVVGPGSGAGSAYAAVPCIAPCAGQDVPRELGRRAVRDGQGVPVGMNARPWRRANRTNGFSGPVM